MCEQLTHAVIEHLVSDEKVVQLAGRSASTQEGKEGLIHICTICACTLRTQEGKGRGLYTSVQYVHVHCVHKKGGGAYTQYVHVHCILLCRSDPLDHLQRDLRTRKCLVCQDKFPAECTCIRRLPSLGLTHHLPCV